MNPIESNRYKYMAIVKNSTACNSCSRCNPNFAIKSCLRVYIQHFNPEHVLFSSINSDVITINLFNNIIAIFCTHCFPKMSDIFPTVPAGNPYDTGKPEDQYHVTATETGNVFI